MISVFSSKGRCGFENPSLQENDEEEKREKTNKLFHKNGKCLKTIFSHFEQN